MRPIEQDFPEGSLITERIEVVAAIIPSGESVLSYRATTSDGAPFEETGVEVPVPTLWVREPSEAEFVTIRVCECGQEWGQA